MMKLHGYWRSSASYRVRIALNLKGIEVEHLSINLKEGEQHSNAFRSLNTQSLVPVLHLNKDTLLTQSMAILDYLEEAYPAVALLPDDPVARAKVKAAAYSLSSDVAPLQNLRVLKYLKNELGHEQSQADEWARHWISLGLMSLEQTISHDEHQGKKFLFSNEPGYAECVLIPQLYNARRFDVDLSAMPNLCRVDEACQKLEAFAKAHPDAQPDSPASL